MAKKTGAKRKKAEKSKTQLKKKTFKLPKGQNVVDISNAIAKKIVMPTQLRPNDTLNPLTRRKLGIKDCVSKLTHYSASMRLDGLEGIRELLTGHPELAETHMDVLISKLSSLCSSDTDKRVRIASMEILMMEIERVSNLTPMYPILAAHLCRALSHIDQDIQRGAWTWIDDLIRTVPDMIAQYFPKILPNFLDQISMSKGENRILSNKVEYKKITLNLWRIQVLRRIQNLLNTILYHRDTEKETTITTTMSIMNLDTYHRKDSETSLSSIWTSLISLLIQMWSVVDSTSMELFETVVTTLRIIITEMKNVVFVVEEEHVIAIEERIRKAFPYHDENVNASLAEIYLRLNVVPSVDFLRRLLEYPWKQKSVLSDSLLKSISDAIVDVGTSTNLAEKLDSLISNSITASSGMTELMLDWALNDRRHLNLKSVNRWIEDLPFRLVDDSNPLILRAVDHLQKRNHPIMMNAFQNYFRTSNEEGKSVVSESTLRMLCILCYRLRVETPQWIRLRIDQCDPTLKQFCNHLCERKF